MAIRWIKPTCRIARARAGKPPVPVVASLAWTAVPSWEGRGRRRRARAARQSMGLAPGAPAVAADCAGGAAAAAGGNPCRGASAREGRSAAGDTGDCARDEIDVAFDVSAGPHADIGPITVTGLKTVNEEYVRRRLALHSGEPSTRPRSRRRAPTWRMSACSRWCAPCRRSSLIRGPIPLTVDVTERPLHAVEPASRAIRPISVLNPIAAWHDRNLFGNAEQLNITAGMSLGGSARAKARLQFRHPVHQARFPGRDQSLEIDLDAIKQSLDAYDQTAR